MSSSILKTKTVEESLSQSFSSSSSLDSAKSVSFQHVETREYPMILDTASLRVPRLTMGWESFSTSVSTVEDHEALSKEMNKDSEPLTQIPLQERLVILLRAGYTAEYLRAHLTQPEEENSKPIKKQKKGLFSKIKFFKRKNVQANGNVARAA